MFDFAAHRNLVMSVMSGAEERDTVSVDREEIVDEEEDIAHQQLTASILDSVDKYMTNRSSVLEKKIISS